MNGQVFPLFEKSNILRTAMLTQMRDYAYEYGMLMHEGFSDGIMSGCAITTTVDTITLNRGVIRYAGRIYFITEPISLAYYPTDLWTIFKLIFKDEAIRGGSICRDVEATLTDQLALCRSEMEICRFKLKTGAKLRINYVDFSDRDTEFDTVNTICVPFAALEKSSISPDITRAFAKEAIKYNADLLDTAFFMQAFNTRGALNRDAIISYLAAKLKKETTDYSNQEIFDSLLLILKQLEGGGQRETLRAGRARRQIIVD